MRPLPQFCALSFPSTESHLRAIAKHKSRRSNYHLAWESFTAGRDLNANIVQSDNLSIVLKITRRNADGVQELGVAVSHRLYFGEQRLLSQN